MDGHDTGHCFPQLKAMEKRRIGWGGGVGRLVGRVCAMGLVVDCMCLLSGLCSPYLDMLIKSWCVLNRTPRRIINVFFWKMHIPVYRLEWTLNWLTHTCKHTLMCTHAISFAWMTHLISEHFRVAVHEVSVTLRAYFILWIEYTSCSWIKERIACNLQSCLCCNKALNSRLSTNLKNK